MPIRADIRHHYGAAWRRLSREIRQVRAGGRCEGHDARGRRCEALNGQPHPVTRSRVVLTVAHLNHISGDDRPENLAAMCQRCHLMHDRSQHVETRRRNWRHAMRTPELPGIGP